MKKGDIHVYCFLVFTGSRPPEKRDESNNKHECPLFSIRRLTPAALSHSGLNDSSLFRCLLIASMSSSMARQSSQRLAQVALLLQESSLVAVALTNVAIDLPILLLDSLLQRCHREQQPLDDRHFDGPRGFRDKMCGPLGCSFFRRHWCPCLAQGLKHEAAQAREQRDRAAAMNASRLPRISNAVK